jgi:hypothetical protein
MDIETFSSRPQNVRSNKKFVSRPTERVIKSRCTVPSPFFTHSNILDLYVSRTLKLNFPEKVSVIRYEAEPLDDFLIIKTSLCDVSESASSRIFGGLGIKGASETPLNIHKSKETPGKFPKIPVEGKESL